MSLPLNEKKCTFKLLVPKALYYFKGHKAFGIVHAYIPLTPGT